MPDNPSASGSDRCTNRDLALLVDMLNAARECAGYVANVDFETFQEDRMRVRAVERMLEIIGRQPAVFPTACDSSFRRRPGGSSSAKGTSLLMSTMPWTTAVYGTSDAIVSRR